MSSPIDLRSDTVSKPGDEMRRVMADAEVGDDVFEEDPSVNRLEAMAAERMGKEAALFVSSGTMGNLLALMVHCTPGDEVLLGRECHILNYEAGGAARIANVMVNPLENTYTGSIDPAAVASSVRAPNIHAPVTRLLCLENTHNRCGGAALPASTMDELSSIAHERGLAVHVDGARIFNAAVALEADAAELVRHSDTVTFCLSKGLGCPVGSLLCGPEDFVQRARYYRKMVGGGMRQAGVLAAAGTYALEHHVDRLADDHAHALELSQAIEKYDAFAVRTPQTNIVIVDILRGSLGEWLAALQREGVLAVPFGPQRMRLVTHINITSEDVRAAIDAIDRAVEAVAP